MTEPNLNERLRRFDRLVTSGNENRHTSNCPPRYQRLADAVSGELLKTQSGTFVVVRTTYQLSHLHGDILLENTATSEPYSLSAFTSGDLPGTVAQRALIFLDTETTGLGGAGAVPFLVGIGRITEAGFEICQYVIPDYADESAMLELLMEQVGLDTTFVTYNGAAFDLPLLRDRVIINRVARDFAGNRRHIDLLHPTRRLFKRRIKECNLVNAERQLLGFHRESDTPGYLIPSIYFDWLSHEDTSRLPGVLEHNRLDILSLHFLLAHIHRVFQSEGQVLCSGEDLYSLSRVYGRRKHHDKALRTCDRISEVQPDISEEMLSFHAQTLKRVGEWQRAVTVWEQLASGLSRESYWANIELAKYHEHRTQDYTRATDHAKRALCRCPYSGAEKQRLEHRLHRLTQKQSDK